jgi:hypothetical protein
MRSLQCSMCHAGDEPAPRRCDLGRGTDCADCPDESTWIRFWVCVRSGFWLWTWSAYPADSRDAKPDSGPAPATPAGTRHQRAAEPVRAPTNGWCQVIGSDDERLRAPLRLRAATKRSHAPCPTRR